MVDHWCSCRGRKETHGGRLRNWHLRWIKGREQYGLITPYSCQSLMLISDFRKILSYGSPSSIIVLQEFNKFIIHHESYLLAYSLDILARVTLYQAPPGSLDASMEKIAGDSGSVLFCRAGRINTRTISMV